MVIQERIVTVEEGDRCDDPIFLIGLHRSGTSLMRRIFNSHPQIACPPETFFLEHYASMLRDPEVAAGYRSFGHDAASMRRHLSAVASQLHEGFRRGRGKRRWADKTPSYVAIVEELLDLFGDRSRFVMIYRHPFDVAHSIASRGWVLWSKADEDVPFNFDHLLEHMAGMYARQMRFEARHPELCVRVYYEDVVTQPEETLRTLMKSLNEDFSPEMLNHHEGSHNFGTEDPIARGLKGFQASFGNWTSWDQARMDRATELLGPVCAELGYSLDRTRAEAGGRA